MELKMIKTKNPFFGNKDCPTAAEPFSYFIGYVMYSESVDEETVHVLFGDRYSEFHQWYLDTAGEPLEAKANRFFQKKKFSYASSFVWIKAFEWGLGETK